MDIRWAFMHPMESLTSILPVLIILQRRQSGLKSGRSWIRVKQFRFFRANFRKLLIFQAISQNIDFSRQISEKIPFFRQFTKDSIVQAKLAIYRYFWANYSTSLQKSSLSNILLSTTPLRLPRSPCPKSGGRDPQTPGLTPLLS